MFETSGMSSPHTQTASGDVGGAAEQVQYVRPELSRHRGVPRTEFGRSGTGSRKTESVLALRIGCPLDLRRFCGRLVPGLPGDHRRHVAVGLIVR